MPIKVTYQDFLRKSKAVHTNENYNYDSVTYIDNQTKIKIYCNIHKKYFFQKPSKHKIGQGCYECGIEKDKLGHLRSKNGMWNGLDFYNKEPLIKTTEFKKKYPSIHHSKNKLRPTIDHKTSLFYGFKNDIDPKIIGSLENLVICSQSTNSKKNRKNYNEYCPNF